MKYRVPFVQPLILLILFADPTLIGQTFGRESRNLTNPPVRGNSFSLNQLIATVLEDNPMIQAARAKWKAATQRIPQAAAWDDPKITGGTIFGRFVTVPANSFTDQMLSVEQMIPFSGKNRSKERIATAEALEVFEEARRETLDIIAKAKANYYRLKNLYELLEFNEADEASFVQAVEITRARLEVGTQKQADVLLAENERQKIVEARRDLEQRISDEQSSLNVLMNRDPFAPVHLAANDQTESRPESNERLRQLILTNRPEIRDAQAKLAVANARVELAKRQWIPDPTVSLEAERYNGASQTVSQVGGGVSFSVPWFNGRKYRAEEAEARAETIAAQDELISEQSQAVGLLRNQLEKIETLHHHIELYRDQLLPTARQTVASYLADYEAGKQDLLTLLSSQRNLFDLESMYSRDMAEFETALAELEALVGLDHVAWRGTKLLEERQTK